MGEEIKVCGWRDVRRKAMLKVHDEIKKREAELGRELTEAEFRDLVRATLKEELRKAFAECGAI
jgi:plasmid stability protein